jgi:hypothetical protein
LIGWDNRSELVNGSLDQHLHFPVRHIPVDLDFETEEYQLDVSTGDWELEDSSSPFGKITVGSSTNTRRVLE